jgi:hypothetical protein
MTNREQGKRKEERVNVALPVDLGDAKGITRDISASGIFFEIDASHALGSTMDLTVELDTPGGKMRLKCHGNIVRVVPNGDKVGVAVKMTEMAMEPLA